MKRILTILAAVLILVSCQKDEQQRVDLNNGPEAQSFDQLAVSEDFNWSSSIKGNVTVKFTSEKIELRHAEVYVVNEQDDILDRKKLRNGEASFYLNYPQVNTNLYFYLPASMERWKINKMGVVNIKVTDPLNIDPNATNNKKAGGSYKGKTATSYTVSGTNLLGNADFEINDFTERNLYSSSNITDNGKWYYDNEDIQWKKYNGSRVVKGDDDDDNSYVYQKVSINGGDSIYMMADFYGWGLAYVVYYNSAGSIIQYCYDYPSNNKVYYSGVAPSNATSAAILFVIDENDKVDNAWLSNPASVQDADNDGVADENDEFPNDASRAYTSSYPTAGTQTLAFEDLWPSRGDYDFNDMIINGKMTFVKNAAGDYVEATAWVSLDARGAGLENGLGLLFVNASKNTFGSNLIASVSGDASLDPDNQNGILVWSSPGEVQSSNYTNTTAGNYATPDTARFTITFANGVDESALIPDYYLFRTNDRGVEVHLPGFSGTAAANANYYNREEDVNGTYLTTSGLPWCMEIIITDQFRFKHPLEKVDILDAYPSFENWAESGGLQDATWYLSPAPSKVVDLNLF